MAFEDTPTVVDQLNYSPNYFQTFQEAVALGHLEPARNNLFEIVMSVPIVLQPAAVAYPAQAWLDSDANGRNIRKNISLFATSVTVPSRNIATTEVHVHGMNRSYASGQSPTDLDITFLVTKDNQHRAFFEQWMHNCASDADNTVGFYDQYVTELQIVKWESGSNTWLNKIIGEGSDRTEYKFRMNQATAVYKCYGVFPKNIGTMTLNNEARSLLELNIQFQMERYRFDTVNIDGLKSTAAPKNVTASTIPTGGEFSKYGV
jgi:hypothetical protein|tara:strand:+ start:5264 stop:6046 length:783 start_codon:yes stop_codon:yes gene_type:complete